jgi:hypothetical protein
LTLHQSDVGSVACTTCAVLGIYFALSSAELLWRAKALDDGLLAWRHGRLRNAALVRGAAGRCLNAVLAYPPVISVIVFRLLAGVLLMTGAVLSIPQSVRILGIVAAAASSMALSLRHAHGSDGADQFALISIVSLCVGSFSDTGTALALAFIAFQALLAYTTAGMAKLVSKKWRDGSGLLGLAQTHTYGTWWLADLFERYRSLPRILSWIVISAQLLMLPLFLAGRPYLLVGLAIGIGFHASMAIVMRLHTFVWAFLNAYPALLWVRAVIAAH